MKKNKLMIPICVAIALVVIAAQERSKREPMSFALDCAGGDCPLLTGAPQTSGMRGGSVKLKPGESVGWHSTSGNEEALVILHGSGVANIEGIPMCRSRKTCSPIFRLRQGTTSRIMERKFLSTSGWSRRRMLQAMN